MSTILLKHEISPLLVLINDKSHYSCCVFCCDKFICVIKKDHWGHSSNVFSASLMPRHPVYTISRRYYPGGGSKIPANVGKPNNAKSRSIADTSHEVQDAKTSAAGVDKNPLQGALENIVKEPSTTQIPYGVSSNNSNHTTPITHKNHNSSFNSLKDKIPAGGPRSIISDILNPPNNIDISSSSTPTPPTTSNAASSTQKTSSSSSTSQINNNAPQSTSVTSTSTSKEIPVIDKQPCNAAVSTSISNINAPSSSVSNAPTNNAGTLPLNASSSINQLDGNVQPSTSTFTTVGSYTNNNLLAAALSNYRSTPKRITTQSNGAQPPVQDSKTITASTKGTSEITEHTSIPARQVQEELSPSMPESFSTPTAIKNDSVTPPTLSSPLPQHNNTVNSRIPEPIINTDLDIVESLTSLSLIPPPPPPPPLPKVFNNAHVSPNILPAVPLDSSLTNVEVLPQEISVDFKTELLQKVVETNKQIIAKLRASGLVDANEESLTRKGNQLFTKKELEKKIKISIPETLFIDSISNEQFPFSVGILDISKIEETLVLQGIHTHVSVLYKTFDDQRLVWAYLTSAKIEGSIELSKDQPFCYEPDKKPKTQMLRILKEPFVVAPNDITPMPTLDKENYNIINPTCDNKNLNVINQQIIGENYLKRDDVKKRLQDTFNNCVIPILKENEGMLLVYNGSGVTLEDSDKLLQSNQDDITKDAQIYFNDYKRNKNQMNEIKLEKWLNKIKTKDIHTYEKLQEFIQKHENNDN